MRLEPTAVESVQKVLKIQELMLTPEARRLQELDEEMGVILKQKNLALAEKIRKFEEKLAEFRQVQEKIIEQGTTTMVDRQRDDRSREDIREVMKSILEDLLQRQPAPGVSMLSSASGASGNMEDASTNMQSALDDYDSSTPGKPTAQSTAAKPSFRVVQQIPQTPPSAMFSKSTDLSGQDSFAEGYNSSQSSESFVKIIESVLKADGMKVEGGRYMFPIKDAKTRNRIRKSYNEYAESTYKRAVAYLLAGEAKDAPHNSENLLSIIRDALYRGLDNYGSLSKKYPNLAKRVGSPSVKFDKWSGLK